MKKLPILIIYISILSLLLFDIPMHASAKSPGIPEDIPYILIDSKTGIVLAEQHADERYGPASTTKIMTAILALEKGDLSREMTVSEAAVNDIGRDGMNVGIMAGEKGLTLENLLNVMLIKSANETANIIAENIAPTRADFVAMMNEKAKEIGAVNTTFVNPCGKDTSKSDAGHLTTPRDLAMIARYAMTLPKFREIVSTEYYKNMPITDKHDDWGILRNTNQFLWYDNTYPYTLGGTDRKYTVMGVKTGYTAKAGNNLVSAADGEDGTELIAVVMHVMQPNKIYSYSKALLRYGFENFSTVKLSEAGQIAGSIPVEGAREAGTLLNLVKKTGFSCVLPLGTDIKSIGKKLTLPDKIKAPVSKGDVIGTLEYVNKGVSLGRVDLTAETSVEAAPEANAVKSASDGKTTKAGKPGYSWFALGVLVFTSIVIALRPILRRLSRKLKKKKNEVSKPDSRESQAAIEETEQDFEELRRIIKGEQPDTDGIRQDVE
ncbi:MAG TPA: D-alanyl-D-alanine carboxypeptidase family protein [Clostridia bacterium]|nr:D-alanyl-D-alanine carboxypeptidase family protein [Clostridia bacterium]